MILTGCEIRRQIQQKKIVISPFVDAQVNPNSYNYRLGPRLLDFSDPDNPVERSIDSRGTILSPKRLYLGHTLEMIGSEHYVTFLNGRSSIGRLGMFLNISADLGQLGPAHQWTLEIVVVQRLRVFPGVVIGQATFWEPRGEIALYNGAYARRSDPTPNLVFQT